VCARCDIALSGIATNGRLNALAEHTRVERSRHNVRRALAAQTWMLMSTLVGPPSRLTLRERVKPTRATCNRAGLS
jgi:hypothetical protein